jgi:hypothetical protein
MKEIEYEDNNIKISFTIENIYKDLESYFDNIQSVYRIKNMKEFRKEMEKFIFSINVEKVMTEELTKQYFDIITKHCKE